MTRTSLCLLCFLPLFAQAADSTPPANDDSGTDFSLGVAGGVNVTPYKSKLHKYSVVPVINYDDKTWFLHGNEGGLYLMNDDVNELKLKAFYDDSEYVPNDAHGAYRHLHSRHSTMMAGASYQRITPIGAIHFQLAADTLNHSKGLTGNLAWLYEYDNGGWTVVPEVGMDWANAQQNRYYYGVTDKEMRRTGIKSYRPGASVTPYMSLTADYAFSGTPWDTYLNGRTDWLAATQRDSPMVGHDYGWSLTWGINYNF
ncbi:MltA-interacting protein [Salmonella enterica subsp. enterica serovar Choleraesuis]|nr:MltA-interacting protein [Salmonella enterica subsp. enterica serovar Choleraesuis]